MEDVNGKSEDKAEVDTRAVLSNVLMYSGTIH
jgi:hypothetical protein